MPLFRKKPVVIEARRVRLDGLVELADWCDGTAVCPSSGEKPFPKFINIKTLEGFMSAQIGDWIIKGVKGEFYPCKPDIFEATYNSA